MKTIFKAALLFAILCVAAPIVPMCRDHISPEELYGSADLVFIGRVEKTGACDQDSPLHGKWWCKNYSHPEILFLIKGKAESIIFQSASSVVDLNIDCCQAESVYVFYLYRKGDNFYYPVFGSFGVSKISGITIQSPSLKK